MASSGVLLTRLLPPRLPPDCLARPELTDRIRSGFAGRLVTVLAGAGYGKSTVVAQAIADMRDRVVWVSCDERLGGAPDLLVHIAAGFERVIPGFGTGLSFTGPVGHQVAGLCNELVATVSDELVLVLDDVHLLDDEANEAVSQLLRDLPPWVHLVLVGRAPLSFPLGKIRAGHLLEVGQADLALTRAEVGSLWKSAGGAEDPGIADRVHRRTEGWVTGVILATQARDADFQGSADSGQLFGYLAEEVLAAQAPEVQDFILQTAMLERFSPDLAARMTGNPDTRGLCRALVARHLFTIRLEAEGEWYRYHHLFQAFLRQRIAESEPDVVPAMHRRAAAAWVAEDQPTEAIDHLLAAGEIEAAADILETVADQMRLSPQGQVLARWLARLPEEAFAGRPGLTLARAIATFWGNQEKAFVLLDRALEDLLAAGEHERAAEAFFMLIYAQLGGGTRQRYAIDVGYRRLALIDPSARLLPAGMVLMASELGCATRYDEAEAMLGQVLQLKLPNLDPLGQGYLASARALFLDHPRGRSKQALATLEWVIGLFERNQRWDTLGYEFALRCYRGIILNQLGRYDETLTVLDEVMALAQRRGIAGGGERIRAKLEAVALAGLERWDELEALLPTIEQPDAMKGASYGVRTRAPAARLAAHRGNVDEVAHHARVVVDYVEAFGFSFDLPGWLCDIAIAAWSVGLADDARRLHRHVLEGAARAQSPWSRTRGQLLGALVLDGADADAALAEALDLTAEWGFDEVWTRRDRAAAARLLGRAMTKGLGPDGLAARLAVTAGAEVLEACVEHLVVSGPAARAPMVAALDAAGVRDPEMRERLTGLPEEEPPRPGAGDGRPPLHICGLGGFVVRRGDQAIPVSAFGRERARALLAALVCAGGPVHRERLLDWLWPDLDVERGLRALHVTIHGLRRALEPELGRGAAARSVIRSEGEGYRLVLRDGDIVDVDAFLDLADPAAGESDRGAAARLRAAERAHTGELYPDWPYAEWSHDRRRQVELAHATVLEQLADHHVAAGRPREAMLRLERLVAIEPEREEFHRRLMLVYAHAGEKALALRQYHACRTVLRRELGVETSPETRALYQVILEDGPLPEVAQPVPA